MASVRPAWQSNTAVVRASAVFRTKLRHLLTYKGMQPAKNGAIWCKKYSPGPFGLCATAVKEEEDEQLPVTWTSSRGDRGDDFDWVSEQKAPLYCFHF